MEYKQELIFTTLRLIILYDFNLTSGKHEGQVRLARVVYMDPHGYIHNSGAPELTTIIKQQTVEALLHGAIWIRHDLGHGISTGGLSSGNST